MNTNAGDAPEPVVDAVLSASRVLVAVASRSLSDIAEDVTITQYRTLVVLASRGPQNLVGLADLVGVTPASATRMCDRLVAKGLIARASDLGDRRQVRLTLTKNGSRLVRTVTDRRRSEIAAILGSLDAKDQVVLVKALSQFASAAGEVADHEWFDGWAL
ncbi:MAG: MarR family transcriptional regulator [Acidimicrobiales bacterium]